MASLFTDKVKITVKSGDGGDGIVILEPGYQENLW